MCNVCNVMGWRLGTGNYVDSYSGHAPQKSANFKGCGLGTRLGLSFNLNYSASNHQLNSVMLV